jgi:hypothetical protein
MQILFGPLRRLGGVNRTPGGGCLSVEFLWRRRCASHFVSLWPHRPALRVGLMATPRIVDAARQGRLDLVQGELHSGTNVDSRCPSSLSTALMAAATRGHMDIVQFLVANGASLNLVNKGGMTALDDARARGNEDVAALLAERGAKSAPEVAPRAWTSFLDQLLNALAKCIQSRNGDELLFVSLGNDCTVKMAMVGTGWAQPTYPFDWVRSFCASQVMVALRTRMSDILPQATVTQGVRTFKAPTSERLTLHAQRLPIAQTWLYDNTYKFVFKHEALEAGVPLPDLAAQVRVKYQRRALRLAESISQARKVVFIRALHGDEGEAVLQHCYRELTSMFTDGSFVLVVLTTDKSSASWDAPPGTEVYHVAAMREDPLAAEMPHKLVSSLQWKHGAHRGAHRRTLFVMMRMCCLLNNMKKQQRFIMPKRALFSPHIYE